MPVLSSTCGVYSTCINLVQSVKRFQCICKSDVHIGAQHQLPAAVVVPEKNMHGCCLTVLRTVSTR